MAPGPLFVTEILQTTKKIWKPFEQLLVLQIWDSTILEILETMCPTVLKFQNFIFEVVNIRNMKIEILEITNGDFAMAI